MCRLWRGVIKSLSYRSSRQATYTIQKQTKHMWKRSLRCVEGGFCTTTQYIILLLITPLPCLYTNVTAGRSVGLLFGTSIEASRSASSAFYIDPEISRKLQSEPGERRWIGIVLDRFIIIIIRGGGAVWVLDLIVLLSCRGCSKFYQDAPTPTQVQPFRWHWDRLSCPQEKLSEWVRGGT